MADKPITYTIGRARECDIVLAEQSVSRHHADLTMLPGGKLQVKDRDSTHGVFVIRGGQATRVTEELLSPADQLQFGDCKIAVGDLLETIASDATHRKPQPAPGPKKAEGEPPHKSPPGKKVRCQCGAIKSAGTPCPDCGTA